ncbi:MAG: filamentous hemagglutinin N-terminal domain-containing protein, partial [Burkholderiaceae bacterium]
MALPMGLACSAGAQIRTDGSLGVAAQTLAGPNYLIPQAIGKLSGNNLFHSFDTFNIHGGQSANFTTTTPGLANVISRVTGGTSSNINGLLKLTPISGTPSFFFINPAGVTFGAGASIDVPGAFHVSTANYVKFADGNFHADLGQASTFSSAAPEAFGFLGTTRATISIADQASVELSGSRAISIVAGDIEIDNAYVTSMSGDIRVAAIGQSARDVGFTGALPAGEGDLYILPGGWIDAFTDSSSRGGSINVSAGNIVISGGEIFSYTVGSGAAGSVTVAATAQVYAVSNGIIGSNSYSSGSAGPVQVTADTLYLDRGSIFSNALGRGNAGDVTVSTTGIVNMVNRAAISSLTSSSGNAGSVSVNAGRIDMDFASIYSRADSSSSGNTGTVDVATVGQMSLANGALIASIAESVGDSRAVTINAASVSLNRANIYSDTYWDGHGGNVAVTVSGDISVGSASSISTATRSYDDAGSVAVTARNITLDGGGIYSKASSRGNAGDVSLAVADTLSIRSGGGIQNNSLSSGDAGAILVDAKNIVVNGGFISATAYDAGDTGSVTVSASGTIALYNGVISSDTSYFSSGNAGNVSVNADSILIQKADNAGVTGIRSQTLDGSTGKGGDIDITATRNLTITNSGVVSTTSFGEADAGFVKISAGDIFIDGALNNVGSTGVLSVATRYGTGHGGDVTIAATGSISLLGGGTIETSSFGIGNAGAIKVSAASIAIDGNTETRRPTGILSEAVEGTGNAGAVTVSTNGNLSLVDTGLISSSTYSAGRGGNVKVDANDISIDGAGSPFGTAIASQSGNALSALDAGEAGTIEVNARGSLAVTGGGTITSSTFTSHNAGTITVTARDIAIDGAGSSTLTGITSDTNYGAGNAGPVDVVATGALLLANGGAISSGTYSSGNAGAITVRAGSVDIVGRGNQELSGIASRAEVGSSGHAGSISLTTQGDLTISHGGAGISTSTFSSGNAGAVTVEAGNILIDGKGDGIEVGISSDARLGSGNAGTVNVVSRGELYIFDSGNISSSTYDSGKAGAVTISTANILVDGRGTEFLTGIFSDAQVGSSGEAGNVDVVAPGKLVVVNGGLISSTAYSAGNAGTVKVRAGDIGIDQQGNILKTGIVSLSIAGSSGNAGNIDVAAIGDLLILNGSEISSSTYSTGNAGTVTIHADNIVVNGKSAAFSTGILSTAATGSSGNAGSVDVSAFKALSLFDGGTISSATFASGNAGSVRVTAGEIIINGPNATGISSQTNTGSGNGGSIDILAAGSISLVNGGHISSGTFTSGNAGSVQVIADSIRIDSSGTHAATGISSDANPGSGGMAGNVMVTARGAISIVDGSSKISSKSFATGDAGSVRVIAGEVVVDGRNSHESVGILSTSEAGSGDAGSVEVVATNGVSVANGGEISSSTFSLGAAGSVNVATATLSVDGARSTINASANAGSSGQTGSVMV